MEAAATIEVLESTNSFNFGSLSGVSLTPWPHPEGFMEFPDRKECHLLRLSIPDLMPGLILDLPKCAEEGSRCSLSLVLTFWAFLKMTPKWTSKWTPLRPKISAGPLLGAPRSDFGNHFCASELKLKNELKMHRKRVVLVIWRPGARPSKIHRISMESPWNLHRISIESPSNLHRGSIDFTATRTPTYIPDARNQKV